MSLTTEQLLLLNNLMYLEPAEGPYPELEDYAGQRIRDWMGAVDLSGITEPDPDYPGMTTAGEWMNIVIAAWNEPFLMDMRILTAYTDLSEGGGLCKSAVFINADSADAVVVFKGTELVLGSSQWKDNFFSGNTADTPHQLKALEWYREVYRKYHLEQFEVTVTGHSKGGNKAKYITIRDRTVDRCVSFDGEGFSDQFFTKYAVEILHREKKIENHCVDFDYISPLLNDIGTTTWYHGYNYGSGGFTENHLANTFMHFSDLGRFTMDINENGRPEEMEALDEFVNSYLRSMNDEERSKALNMLNELLNASLSVNRNMTRDEVIRIFLKLADNPDNCTHISYFLAYLIRYEQKRKDMTAKLNSVLTRFGMTGLTQYADLVAGIINWKKQILWISLSFDHLASAVSTINTHAPKWVYHRLSLHLERKGVILPAEELARLADIIEMTDSYLKTAAVYEDGSDRRVHLARPAEPES